MKSANQKVTNLNSKPACFKKTDNCPRAMIDWVEDDKSLGLLPSYEKLKICQGTQSLRAVTDMSKALPEITKQLPQISGDALAKVTVCSSNSIDTERKAVFKSAYFLARAENAVQKNINQIAAYDLFLNDKKNGLGKINCDASIFVNLQTQCKNVGACALPANQKKLHVAEVAQIEKENKAIDESIEKLKEKLPYAKLNIGGYAAHGGKDPKVLQQRKDELKKIEDQIQTLSMIKQMNLQKYPVLTHPDYIEARDDDESVEQALTKAYTQERKNLVEQTQNVLDKSLCTVAIDHEDCSPSDLNEVLMQTPALPEVQNRKAKDFAVTADGLEQQRCIFENVVDRKATSQKIYKAALHAGVDIGLTLIPGGAAIVLAGRAKAAAEAGVSVTRAAAKAARTTEVVNATVSTAWLAQSSVEAISSCQTKYTKIKSATQDVLGNQCANISGSFHQSEFSSSDCTKAILFAAMDGLPIVAQAATYKQRAEKLGNALRTSESTAVKVQTEQSANVAKAKVFKDVEIQNPQQQIWREKKTGSHEKANKVASAVQEDLKNGKIVEDKSVVAHGGDAGRSGARFVKYESGLEGVWKKDVPGENSTSAEMAAVLVDQHLGAEQVPITVYKELDGVMGTVQLKVNGLKTSRSSNPEELQLTDYLNGNSDRTMAGNHVETPDGKAVAIDGGRAFKSKEGITYGYVSNPIEPKLIEIENIQRRLAKTEENLKKLTDGTASEAFKTMYSEAELRQALKELKAEEAAAKASTRRSLERMIPNDQWVVKLRATKRSDWERLLGQQLSSAQISELVERQKDILTSLERSQVLLQGK